MSDTLCFAVRAEGTWTLTPVPETEPVAADLDHVLQEMAATEGGTGPLSGSWTAFDGPPLAADQRIAPVWMVVGAITDGRFVVGGPKGTDVGLDGDDVRLLDALTDSATAQELAERGDLGSVDDLRLRCGRLVEAGCAWLTGT